MDINLSNFHNNQHVNFGEITSNTEAVAAKGNVTSGGKPAPANLDFSKAEVDALLNSEPITDVPESALDRNDALGKLVNAVFSLPPPPMPSFA